LGDEAGSFERGTFFFSFVIRFRPVGHLPWLNEWKFSAFYSFFFVAAELENFDSFG